MARSSVSEMIAAILSGSDKAQETGAAQTRKIASRGLDAHLPVCRDLASFHRMSFTDSVEHPALPLIETQIYWVISRVTSKVIYRVRIRPTPAQQLLAPVLMCPR
jgi:hypothetical protein